MQREHPFPWACAAVKRFIIIQILDKHKQTPNDRLIRRQWAINAAVLLASGPAGKPARGPPPLTEGLMVVCMSLSRGAGGVCALHSEKDDLGDFALARAPVIGGPRWPIGGPQGYSAGARSQSVSTWMPAGLRWARSWR